MMTSIQKLVLSKFDIGSRTPNSKGWVSGGQCPFCKRSDKFGIKLNQDRTQYRNHISFNCWHGSCQARGTEYTLFKQMGILHELKDYDLIGDINTIQPVKRKCEVIKKKRPLFSKNVPQSDYLDSRGFSKIQYMKYKPYTTRRLDGYIMFDIIQDGVLAGYIGRLLPDKDSNLPKYINEEGVDFESLIFGYDDLIFSTRNLILVEGIFDKFRIDRFLKKMRMTDTKCVVTFGKSISECQMLLLGKIKSVKNITIFYDSDAVKVLKTLSFKLSKKYNTKIVRLVGDEDAADLNDFDLENALNTALTPALYFSTTIQKKTL